MEVRIKGLKDIFEIVKVKKYAREHTFTCLFPAFFIAGFIASMFPREFILKYLSKGAPIYISHSIAGIAGFALSVCSCTILSLFASVYYSGSLYFAGNFNRNFCGLFLREILRRHDEGKNY